MADKKPWVDGPFPLISASKSGAEPGKKLSGAQHVAKQMSMVHNWLIRGANAIYLQCANVSTQGSVQDMVDFANFAFQWAEMVHEHHESEETILFPDIDRLAGVPGLMNENVEEHTVFQDGLKEYSEYLKDVKEGKGKLDGEKLKLIMDSFLPALHKHLVNEIDTLLNLAEYQDKVDWEKWFQEQKSAMAKRNMGDSQFRSGIFPFLFVLHDKTSENGIWSDHPPFPWIVSIAMRWLFVNKNLNWWRFAGCDTDSVPQELPFA